MNYDNGGNNEKMNSGVEELRRMKESAKQMADKRGGPMLVSVRTTMLRQKRDNRKMELEQIKQKISDDEWGKGFFNPDDEGDE
jgi:hypothetical protein